MSYFAISVLGSESPNGLEEMVYFKFSFSCLFFLSPAEPPE
jgi:hypothetical protein